MAYKVIVTIDHECSLRQLRNTLDKDFETYCSGYYDYYFFEEKITELEVKSISKILSYGLTDQVNSLTANQKITILPCNGEDRTHLMHFYRFISEEMGIIFAYPRITGQGEVYLYHSLDTSTHSILLEKMQQTLSFQIITIEEYPVEEYYNNYLFSVPELAQNMTNRQLEILAEAYYGGYYKIPRTIRTRDIAERNQSSRYNIDKILRNVEGKIMQYIYPFLR